MTEGRGAGDRPAPRPVRKVRVEASVWEPASKKARDEEGTTISAKIRGFLIRYIAGEDS